MLTRLIPTPAAEYRRGTNQVRQQVTIREHFRRRNATGQGNCRRTRGLGTRSSDFVNASLLQLQAAARLPCGGISEMALNAALAMIEAAAPKDEMEAALAIQMACTHAATMSVLARLGGDTGPNDESHPLDRPRHGC
jgi:hypothetical protein